MGAEPSAPYAPPGIPSLHYSCSAGLLQVDTCTRATHTQSLVINLMCEVVGDVCVCVCVFCR